MPPRSAVTLSGRSANRATIWHRTVICPAGCRRPRHDTLGGRLRGGHGFDLQQPPAGAGSDGRWHAICGHPTKADDRRDDLRRAVSALDGADKVVASKAAKGRRWTPARPPTIQAPGIGPQDRFGVGGVGLGRPVAAAGAAAGLRGAVHRRGPSRPFRRPRSLGSYRHAGCAGARASAALGWWRLRDFAWPTREAAIRRLERDSGVPHRPLVAVQDRLAAGENDSMAAALWEAHRRREAARLAGLSQQARASRPRRPRHLGAALRADPGPDRGPRHRRRLAQRSHGRRLHAGLPAAAAGGRQSVDRAAGLYRQAADLSRHGRARQAAARAGRQQARGLRRRRARPQAAAAGDRRQGHRVRHRRQGQVPGRAGHHRGQGDHPAGARRRAGALEAARHSRPGADHRVRQADRRRQVVDQDRLHRRRRFRRDRRAAADPPARQRAGRRHAERRRGARGPAHRPAGRRQHQEGRRHLRARPHQPSLGRPQGHGDAVRLRCAGPEGPQLGRDLPAARARVQRPDGARADRAAQGADARSQGLPPRRRRRHAPDPGQAGELPQRPGGAARPAHRRGAPGAERRQAHHHRHPEAPVGSRHAPGERRHVGRRAGARAGAPGAARRHAAPGRRRGDRAPDPAALQRHGPLAEGAGREDEGSGRTPPHDGAGGEDGSQQHHHRRRPAEDARQDSRDGQERPARGSQAPARRAAQDDGKRHAR